MPDYICKRCGYKLNNKTKLKNHYSRKYPCKNIHNAPSVEECIEELYCVNTIKSPKIPKFDTGLASADSDLTSSEYHLTPIFSSIDSDHNPVNSDFISDNENTKNCNSKPVFICEYCGEKFTRYNELIRHIKSKCKCTPETVDELINNNKVMEMQMAEKDKLVAEKDKVMEEMKKQIEMLLDKVGDTNINNTNTNNVIVLNGFGKEDLSYITGDFVQKLINAGPYACIPKLARRVHFHPSHKENHNIKIPNKGKNIASVFNGKRWLLCDKREVIQDMSDRTYSILQKHYIIGSNERMDSFQSDYENEDITILKRIHKDIEFTILNHQSK